MNTDLDLLRRRGDRLLLIGERLGRDILRRLGERVLRLGERRDLRREGLRLRGDLRGERLLRLGDLRGERLLLRFGEGLLLLAGVRVTELLFRPRGEILLLFGERRVDGLRRRGDGLRRRGDLLGDMLLLLGRGDGLLRRRNDFLNEFLRGDLLRLGDGEDDELLERRRDLLPRLPDTRDTRLGDSRLCRLRGLLLRLLRFNFAGEGDRLALDLLDDFSRNELPRLPAGLLLPLPLELLRLAGLLLLLDELLSRFPGLLLLDPDAGVLFLTETVLFSSGEGLLLSGGDGLLCFFTGDGEAFPCFDVSSGGDERSGTPPSSEDDCLLGEGLRDDELVEYLREAGGDLATPGDWCEIGGDLETPGD